MKLSKDWQPSQEVMQQYKEVNHARETKYFKHFYITNQYKRSDWNQVYRQWCDRQSKSIIFVGARKLKTK